MGGDVACVLAGGQRHKDRHRADEQQHEDESDKQHGLLEYGEQVDFRPRCYEKDGDEEAVGHAIEFLLKPIVALGDDVAQHEACSERTQHDVEIKHSRQRYQPHQQQHDGAHHGLRRAVGVRGEEVEQPMTGFLGFCRHYGHRHRDGHECQQDKHGFPFGSR